MTLHSAIAPSSICDPSAALDHWYRTPLGRQVANAETRLLTPWLESTFGYYLLHYGALNPLLSALDGSRVRHRIVLSEHPTGAILTTPPNSAPVLSVQADFTALPFASDSLDVLVLPHTLEFVADAQQVLCEAERVLMPDGHVVILGFNPLSSWGAWRWWPPYRQAVPWCGQWRTLPRLCEWLAVVGLCVERQEQLLFGPPWQPQLAWLEQWGARYWHPLGAVYAVQAVKRVSTLTPLRWRQRYRRAPLVPRPLVTGARVR